MNKWRRAFCGKCFMTCSHTNTQRQTIGVWVCACIWLKFSTWYDPNVVHIYFPLFCLFVSTCCCINFHSAVARIRMTINRTDADALHTRVIRIHKILYRVLCIMIVCCLDAFALCFPIASTPQSRYLCSWCAYGEYVLCEFHRRFFLLLLFFLVAIVSIVCFLVRLQAQWPAERDIKLIFYQNYWSFSSFFVVYFGLAQNEEMKR